MFDGLLGATQEWMRRNYTLDPYTMMYYINIYMAAILSCTVALTGELTNFLQYLFVKPALVEYLVVFGLTCALGQIFLYYTITQFGPLSCSIVTTTRKFCNVLFSVLFFSHFMSVRMWLCVLVVFGGLFWDGVYQVKSKN